MKLLLLKQIAANVLWLHLIIVAEVINRNAPVGQSTLVEAAGEFSAFLRAPARSVSITCSISIRESAISARGGR
jgi:hypothetical protein